MCRVLRIGPVSVHVLDGPIDSVRIVRVVVTMDVFTNFHVEKLFSDFKVGQQTFVVICKFESKNSFRRRVYKMIFANLQTM